MTTRVQSKVEQVCQEFDCTYCSAQLGERCRSLTGGWPLPVSHGARFLAATAAGKLPLPKDQR